MTWDRRKFTWTLLVVGIISVLLGAAMITWPEEVQQYFSLAVGIVFLAAGILNIILYFVRSMPTDGMNFAFASGTICMLLGIVFLINQKQAFEWMIAIIGFFIMAGSLLHIQLALNSRRLGGSNYRYLLYTALFTLVVGGVFLFAPFKAGKLLNLFAGIALVVDGLCKVWFMIQMIRVTKKAESGKPQGGSTTIVYQERAAEGPHTQEVPPSDSQGNS